MTVQTVQSKKKIVQILYVLWKLNNEPEKRKQAVTF